jgi:hypothetical protein
MAEAFHFLSAWHFFWPFPKVQIFAAGDTTAKGQATDSR